MGDSEQVEWKFMKLYLTDIVKTISNKSATRRSKIKPVAYHEEQQPEVATPQSSERQLRTPQRNSRRQSPRTRSSVLKEQERGFSPLSGSGEESDKEASPPKRRNGISSSKKTRTKSPSKDCGDCSGAEPGEQLEESTKRKCKYSNSKKKRTNIRCKEEDNDNLSDEQTVVASPRKRRKECSDFNVFEAETEKYNTVSEPEVEDVVEEETKKYNTVSEPEVEDVVEEETKKYNTVSEPEVEDVVEEETKKYNTVSEPEVEDVVEEETKKYNTVSEPEVEDVVEEETEVASASKRRKQRSPPKKTMPRGEDKAESDHYELGEQAEETTPSRKCSESKKVRTRTPSEDVVEVESAHFKTEEHAEDTTLRKRQRRSKKSKKKRSKSPPKEASDTESDAESGKHISKTWPKDFHEEELDQDAKTRPKDLSEESDQGSQTESKDLSEEEWHCSDHSEKETEHEVLPAKRKRGPKSKKTMKSDSENVTVKKKGKKQGAVGLKGPRIRFTPPVEKRIRVKTLHICSFCEKVLPNRAALSRHLQRHTGEKPYHCEECGKDYGSKTTLKIHNMQVHHKGTKDFICNECDQKFTHLTYLKRHMYSHTDKEKRPHLCNVCGKHFIQKSHLDRHKMIHTGEKPFSCEHCAMAFNRPEYLRMHLKPHVSGSEGPDMAEQEKTKCTECNKSFVNPKYLNIHMRMHTGERPYKCEHCAKSFTQTSILNAHRRTHTGEKPHKCKLCGSCFTRRKYLDDHIGRKHGSLQQMKEQEDEQ